MNITQTWLNEASFPWNEMSYGVIHCVSIHAVWYCPKKWTIFLKYLTRWNGFGELWLRKINTNLLNHQLHRKLQAGNFIFRNLDGLILWATLNIQIFVLVYCLSRTDKMYQSINVRLHVWNTLINVKNHKVHLNVEI